MSRLDEALEGSDALVLGDTYRQRIKDLILELIDEVEIHGSAYRELRQKVEEL